MKIGGYDIDILVQGYPGKTVCHGGLGWSTIALIRGAGRVVLVDVGAFGYRTPLIKRLADRGLKPADVTDVILTHCHHDHAINWVLFPKSRISIGREEMEWGIKEPWGETPVPELYVKELMGWPTLNLVKPGDEIFPGFTAYAAPGHTPGHLYFVLKGAEHDAIFSGDSAKNRAEMLSLSADMTIDPAISKRTMESIWAAWRARPGNVLIPGHDVPMVLEGGKPKYVGKREAAIRSWFGDDLEQTTLIELVV